MLRFETLWSISLVPVVIIAIFVSVVIFIYAYLKIRPKFPIRVNCWFCHRKSEVPYDNRNCWDCPHCEQYNGFSADGGYNKLIPAQHDELLNHSVTAKSSFTKRSPPTSLRSPLCRKCTINQDLKIQQLSSFTPKDPAAFDEEVEEYRLHLERAYQLCESCERIVKQTLHQQQGWLLDQHRKHLISLRSQPTQHVIAWWQRGLPAVWMQWVHAASSAVALWLLMAHCHGVLAKHFGHYISPDLAYVLEITPRYDHIVVSVITCVIIALTGCSMYRRRVDVITSVCWFALLIHKWLLFWPYMKNHLSEEDLKMGHMVVIGLTFLVSMTTAVTSIQVCPSKPMMLKRLKPDVDRVCRGRDITERFSSPAAAVAGDHISNKSSSSFPCLSDSSPPLKSSTNTNPAELEQYSSVQSTDSFGLNSAHNSSCPGELEWVLGKLSLGPSSRGKRNTSTLKTQSCSMSNDVNIFQSACHSTTDTQHLSGKHSPLLRPAKLNIRRNVTQTSWVAGGYWRELGGTLSKAVKSGRNFLETNLQSQSFSPMSRTSSQSSGFHSRSSNSPISSPNSCCGSLCSGDADCFSVVSEPAAPLVACHCGANEHAGATFSKVPIMGMPYYGGYPLCVPHVYPLNVSPASPNVFSPPHSSPWTLNPSYFGAPKTYCPSSYCFSPYSHRANLSSDVLSHTGSSVHSKNWAVMPAHVKNTGNMWQIIKQNVWLSILFIGSILVNVIGLGMLIYKNTFLFQV